jgi:hypothetical protein
MLWLEAKRDLQMGAEIRGLREEVKDDEEDLPSEE